MNHIQDKSTAQYLLCTDTELLKLHVWMISVSDRLWLIIYSYL